MFKEDFKYYKSKKPPPDLEHVIDFNTITDFFTPNINHVELHNAKYTLFGLKPPEKWNAYEVLSNPGLIFIQNPFTPLGQRYWCVRGIKDYSKKPNKTNLDALNVIPHTENWWEFCNAKGSKNLLEKLRWATLGYHHNWDTKVYSEDLRNLIGYKEFKAEAAIVNYYHFDSTLSGHTDHSEKNLEAPLFSFSFGQTAIFLLGGEDVSVKPTALFLHSGDVIVMSKETRLAYHGVPRIMKAKEEPWQQKLHTSSIDRGFDEEVYKICCDDESWKPFKDYMSYSRININVRQVLNQVADCKQKWRNLRTVYVRKLKAEAESGGKRIRSYYLTSAMEFLKPFVRAHKPVNLNSSPSEFEYVEAELSNSRDSDNNELEDETELEEIQDEEAYHRNDISVKIEEIKTTRLHPSRSSDTNESADSPMAEKLILPPMSRKRKLDADNPRIQFLLSMEPDIQIMTDAQMRKFKRKVLEIINEILDE